MMRRYSLWALALLLVVPLSAQAQAGMQVRLDRSTNAADPDDVPDITLKAVGDGFQVNTGPLLSSGTRPTLQPAPTRSKASSPCSSRAVT